MSAAAAPLWTADALLAATGGAATRPFHVSGVSIDTRTLRPGDLFVALAGEHGDGHAHVAEALSRGAGGCLVREGEGLPDDAPLLLVADTLAALTALGAAGRERFTGALAAITGSVGKTTTKEMLRLVLAASGPTHAAVASYNNHWGVPLTLARLPEDAAFCVAELGMNTAGEIAPLARLAGPDVAVVTAVESAHIGRLGSIEAIADEKAAILEGLLGGGTAVLPADGPMAPRLLAAAHAAAARAPGGLRVRRFGTPAATGEADSALLSCEGDADGSALRVRIAGRELSLHLGAPGRHMAFNALAALTAADALGADLDAGAAALAGFRAVGGRGARRAILGGAATLLDESYNASAVAVRAALAVLRTLPARRRILVLGDMLELGRFARAEHEGLAPDVAASADLLYACGPMTKHLLDALPADRRGAHAPDSATLAPLVARDLRPGDAVLVKGSLGSRMAAVVAALDALPAPDAPGRAATGRA